MDVKTTATGRRLYVDPADAERGSHAAFLVAYTDPERSNRWGYYCTNCDGLDTAMDTMGRIVCNDCPNRRKPTEWDAAHE